MGLDNFPDEYPCKARGVAVFIPDLDKDGNETFHADGSTKLRFSCQKTMEAGVCPLHNHPTRPAEGAVYGMLGTDCWYRGKYGTFLLELLDLDDNFLYGGEGNLIHEEELVSMADEIDEALLERLDEYGRFEYGHPDGTIEDKAPDIKYLSWWLRFMAEEGTSVVAWY